MTVAQTILEQLGGKTFALCTGAKNFVGEENALSFRLPANFAEKKINFVKITLGADDLYTVEFKYIRGVTIKDISTHEGIYCDMLDELFIDQTGLYTRLN